MQAGAYSLTAVATDNEGLQTTSAAVPIAVGAAQALYFIHADHLNAPRLVADSMQKTVWRWDQQEPFGNNPADEDPDGDGIAFSLPQRFPGQYYDAETLLHYNYFRDYDATIGRYVESDPIGLKGGLNPFVYVTASPIRISDPSGLAKWVGEVNSFNLANYSGDEYDLESECKCGVTVTIKVKVDSIGLGFSRSRGMVEFEDGFDCPNPMAFAGPVLSFNAGIGLGSRDVDRPDGNVIVPLGLSYSRASVGVAQLKTNGIEAATFLGASIGPAIGSAEVLEIQSRDCCKKASK